MNVYKVGDVSLIDQKLLDSVDWPESKPYCSFIFKQTPMNPVKPLSFRVSPKYEQMLYCFSTKAGIKLPVQPPLAGITTRPPKNQAELVRFSRLDHRKLLKEEGKKAGYSARHDYEIYEKKFLPKAKALLFFKNGKFLGLAVHFRRKNIYGNIESYMSWHPILKGLTPAELRSAQYQEADWLKKSCKDRVSLFHLTKVDAYYKFYAGMGFRTDRVLFERKGA